MIEGKDHRLYVADRVTSETLKDVRNPVVLLATEKVVPMGQISPVVETLLNHGAGSFVCYGPDARDLQLEVDSQIMTSRVNEGKNREKTGRISTVGEGGDPLKGVVWEFLNICKPNSDVPYDFLVVYFGSEDFLKTILSWVDQVLAGHR